MSNIKIPPWMQMRLIVLSAFCLYACMHAGGLVDRQAGTLVVG